MDSLTETEVRGSFVNCTKGEARRLRLPAALSAYPWADADFLGWVDLRAPLQCYLVVPTDGGPLGIQLRRNTGGTGPKRARMCSLCLTTHSGPGVSLMVAPRAGRAGRDGNSVGVDICADLACSGYVRGLVPAPSPSALRETLSTGERIDRLRRNLLVFTARVTAP